MGINKKDCQEYVIIFFMISLRLRTVKNRAEKIFILSQKAYHRAYKRDKLSSWSRHPLPNLTKEFIAHLKKMSSHPTVLDSGCGDGSKTIQLAQMGVNVIGIDHENLAIKRGIARLKENPSLRVKFLHGDARNLERQVSENKAEGVFDYQCLSSIPSEFWQDVSESYYTIIKPGGWLLIDLLNLESPNFHGDISEKLKGSHEYAFKYDSKNPNHKDLEWEDGLYVYFFDEEEISYVFDQHFSLKVLEKRVHPYDDKRTLWSALLQSNKK